MAEQNKERPLHELLTSTIADIYVGSNNNHWPLHEKLLCYHSPVFRTQFYDKDSKTRPGQNKSYGLPDEDDLPFEMLVGWLYSRSIKPPQEEKEIGPLLDLYLLSEKLQMEKLGLEVVETVRQYYHDSNAYPGLRRVQYIYANTGEDNAMREMMVSSIARYLALNNSIPSHWNKALRKNGELAVDIIRAIQEWNLEGRSIPDARDGSMDRGRATFSKIDASNTGDESFNSEDQPTEGVKSEEGEAGETDDVPTPTPTPQFSDQEPNSTPAPQSSDPTPQSSDPVPDPTPAPQSSDPTPQSSDPAPAPIPPRSPKPNNKSDTESASQVSNHSATTAKSGTTNKSAGTTAKESTRPEMPQRKRRSSWWWSKY